MTDTAVPRLEISSSMATTLMAELKRRGQGQREAGAFLLADREALTRLPGYARVAALAFYDDLDPASLTGNITFGAVGYSALNARCRAESLRVIADIHTHPRRWVAQSPVDAAHPMAAVRGHIAIIAPNYAYGQIKLSDLGVHVFNAPGWTSYFDDDVEKVITITGSSGAGGILARLRAAAQFIQRLWRRK
jgi:hypothetical protein